MTEAAEAGLAVAPEKELALRRLLRNMEFDSVPLLWERRMVKQMSKNFLEQLDVLLETDLDQLPLPVVKFIEMPKEDFTTRPIAILEPEIRLVYQFLVERVARKVEPQITGLLDNVVYSNRLQVSDSAAWFRDPNESYSKFKDDQRAIALSGQFAFALKIDVANYYERIYQHHIKSALEQLGVDEETGTRIATLMRLFSRGVSYGVPQGPWASNYLANVYLLPLDHRLVAGGYRVLRYVDDYVVFATTEIAAKKALLIAIKQLRELGLNVNVAKTEIVPVSALLPHLRPLTQRFLDLRQRKRTVITRVVDGLTEYFGQPVVIEETEEELDEEEESALDAATVREFEDLWRDAIDQESRNKAILTFALSGLGQARSAGAELHILSNLEAFPYVSPTIYRYLASLGYKQSTCDTLLQFLLSESNIYDWQELWLLQYFRLAKTLSRELTAYLLSRITDRNKHEAVRVNCLEILSALAPVHKLGFLKELYQSEDNLRVKRAILTSLSKLPASDRNHFLGYCRREAWSLGVAAEFSKQLASE